MLIISARRVLILVYLTGRRAHIVGPGICSASCRTKILAFELGLDLPCKHWWSFQETKSKYQAVQELTRVRISTRVPLSVKYNKPLLEPESPQEYFATTH